MTVVAIIPFSLLRETLLLRKKRTYDERLSERFGYTRSRWMTPAVIYTTDNLDKVHCGDLPIVAFVGYKYIDRFSHSVGYFINTAGQLL